MIETEVLITNGYLDIETIANRAKCNWKFVVTVPAKLVAKHATEHDKATFFVREIEDTFDDTQNANAISNKAWDKIKSGYDNQDNLNETDLSLIDKDGINE